jgi:hypothetical protein
MSKTYRKTISIPSATFLVAGLAVACFLLLIPAGAFASEETARRGGGNALWNASAGIEHANIASDIFSRLTFAATRGGMPVEDNPLDGGPAGGEEGSGGEAENSNESGPATFSLPENASENGGDHSNGGVGTGDGGNGGDAGAGGLVRAGSVASNAQALNMLNVIMIRFSNR